MKSRILMIFILIAVFLLSGCVPKNDLSAAVADGANVMETEKPTCTPEATPEQSEAIVSSSESDGGTRPEASPAPTKEPEATPQPTTKPTSQSVSSEPTKAVPTPKPSNTPKPTNPPKQEEADKPAKTPEPVKQPPAPTPSPIPSPEPEKPSGRTICNTCGADITGKVAPHGDSHLLNGESFSYRVE